MLTVSDTFKNMLIHKIQLKISVLQAHQPKYARYKGKQSGY